MGVPRCTVYALVELLFHPDAADREQHLAYIMVSKARVALCPQASLLHALGASKMVCDITLEHSGSWRVVQPATALEDGLVVDPAVAACDRQVRSNATIYYGDLGASASSYLHGC